MVKACSAPGCRYQYMKGDDIKMHSFPTNIDLRSQWLQVMQKLNCPQYPSKGAVVCSQHFEKHCYDTSNGRMMLKRNAVPSIFYDSKSIRPVVIYELPISECNIASGKVIDPVVAGLQKIFGEDQLMAITDFENKLDLNQQTTNVNVSNLGECINISLEDTETEQHQTDHNDKLSSVHANLTYQNEIQQSSDCDDGLEELVDGEKNGVEYIYEMEELHLKRARKQPHFIGDFIYEDLEDPVQRKKYWLMSHKVITDQKRKLKYYSGRVKALEKRTEILSRQLVATRERAKIQSETKFRKKLIYVSQKGNVRI